MPIYEYQCVACGHALEKLQKISDAPLLICPVCEAPKLEKIISQAGFRLKGTGWYETDFKNAGKKPQTESSSENGHAASSDSKTPADKKEKNVSSSASSGATEKTVQTDKGV